jgi:N-acetylglucosaminyldiphosphoundecaprenol N-acetyl-beta-D-mannosaminyltransferase
MKRVNILGVGVSPVNSTTALQRIEGWIEEGVSSYVCVTGVHGIMESQRNPAIREIHNQAGMVTPDGMPLVWISRLRGNKHVERVYGPDLMLALLERSRERGYRNFFYGGQDGIPELLISRFQERFPGLQVAGGYSPPFRSLTAVEDDEIVHRIRRSAPDIIWVGLSTPKQEIWMADHVSKLDSMVLIGVGAAFDFHAGVKPQAPRWMQRNGLEWLFRLLTEPGRLWRRYLINNPLFVLMILAQSLGISHYDPLPERSE